MSAFPNRLTALPRTCSANPGLAMSPVMPAICGLPEKKSGGARSAITTCAPSSAKPVAMARPMPWEPPLTMATLPAKRPSPNAASLG